MPNLTFREFLKVIEANGFVLDRQKGSHKVYLNRSASTLRLVVVAVHREADHIKPGTLASMIRQTGLPKRLFKA